MAPTKTLHRDLDMGTILELITRLAMNITSDAWSSRSQQIDHYGSTIEICLETRILAEYPRETRSRLHSYSVIFVAAFVQTVPKLIIDENQTNLQVVHHRFEF
jgi:hypothetical protein